MRILLVALALGACVAPSGRDAGPGPLPGPDDSCGSSRVADLIGRQRSGALVEQVARRSGAERVRWIRPDDAVTQDFRPERLNVYLDERDRIRRFSCG